MYFFDIKQLVTDLGGPTKVANIVGKVRTAIYGWYSRGNMGVDDLATLKGQFPDVDLNRYVKRKRNDPSP